MDLVIARHCVGKDPKTGLSPMQKELLENPAPVRIASAPTGAGKSYAFKQAMVRGERVLFIVPTRRLAQNLYSGIKSDLINQDGWSEEQAKAKLAVWSGDETQRLKAEGVDRVPARRLKEIMGLDMTRPGGEMVIAIPETLSWLLLRPALDPGLSRVGILDIAQNFDHVVFDEFHTISPRGFGLAAVTALLAAIWKSGAMKVSFLSATPLDIAPVLIKTGAPEDKIAFIKEPILDAGRAVHGDVRLHLCRAPDLTSLVEDNLDALREEIASGAMTVMIFDELRSLQMQLPRLESVLEQAGIKPGEALAVSSIHDSAQGGENAGFFRHGRAEDPRRFKFLAATSSVEMGVTFRANLLFMEPGFQAMNFLQRYGRAARGDVNGRVFVRLDENVQRGPWLRKLKKFVEANQGQASDIESLTLSLTKSLQKQFKPQAEETLFGALPNRAAYAAGLFWQALIAHRSMKGFQAAHLRDMQPPPAKAIGALIARVRKLEKHPRIGRYAKDWLDRFENEARTLRDFDAKIRVFEPDGKNYDVSEYWLERNTDILFQYPVLEGKNRDVEVHISAPLDSYMLDKKNRVQKTVTARFPHKDGTESLLINGELVKNWCDKLREDKWYDLARTSDPELLECLDAAVKLVQLTGLVVSDADVGMDSCAGVL